MSDVHVHVYKLGLMTQYFLAVELQDPDKAMYKSS
jgi:hypothetical protein